MQHRPCSLALLAQNITRVAQSSVGRIVRLSGWGLLPNHAHLYNAALSILAKRYDATVNFQVQVGVKGEENVILEYDLDEWYEQGHLRVGHEVLR